MLPRLLATDLDGTIVGQDGTISERTVAALVSLVDLGVRVVFATGRPPRWIYPVVEATGITGPVICSNGAQVYDTASDQILVEHVLEESAGKGIAADLRHRFPDAAFAVEIGTGFGHEPDFAPGWDPPAGSLVGTVDQLLAGPVVKLMARCPESDPDELLFLARQIIGDRATVTRSIGISLVEVCRRGIDKATTLATLAAGWGIDAPDVLAFGDQANDAAMLAWAGRSVAVANAHAEAIDAASETTASVEEDGVAQVIEKLITSGVRSSSYTAGAPPV